MSEGRFVRLIEEFCHESGIDEPHRVFQDNTIIINDIRFLISYNEHACSNRLNLFCEFGKVPQRLQHAAYQAILEANLLLCHKQSAGQFFALMPDTGEVVFIHYLDLELLNSSRLRDIFMALAEQAKAWQSDYFLEAESMC